MPDSVFNNLIFFKRVEASAKTVTRDLFSIHPPVLQPEHHQKNPPLFLGGPKGPNVLRPASLLTASSDQLLLQVNTEVELFPHLGGAGLLALAFMLMLSVRIVKDHLCELMCECWETL